MLPENAQPENRCSALDRVAILDPVGRAIENRDPGGCRHRLLEKLELLFNRAFADMVQQGCRALIVFPDNMLWFRNAEMATLAAQHRLPAMYAAGAEAVDLGGLMSYAPNISAMYQTAARFVDKILKGAKPANLPVEQPTMFELVINLKTAKALGIKIPQSVLLRADRLIE